MYSFLRSPKWVAGHALALVGVVLFVSAGFWQLRRLGEVRTYNATVAERIAASPRPLAEVLDDVGTDPDDLAYRRVTVTGTYLTDEEVLSVAAYQGRPGHRLLTPLATDGGGVVVSRGWIPLELNDPPVAQAAPVAGDDGEVTVTGILLPPERAGGTTGGVRAEIVRAVDLGQLQGQVSVDLAPVYLLARSQDPPPPGDLPVPLDLAPLDEGNHRSYAVQWFLFAAVVVVGYPLLLRRTARDRDGGPSPVPGREPSPPVRTG